MLPFWVTTFLLSTCKLTDTCANLPDFINRICDDSKSNLEIFGAELFCIKRLRKILPFMEYCCHVWSGALDCYFDMLDKL